MTEQDWLTCNYPQVLLRHLQRAGASERKLRLFAVACSRRVVHLSRDPRVGDALGVAEQFADGLVGDDERSNARVAAQHVAQVRGVTARPEAPKWERRAASVAYYAAARRATEAARNVPGLAVEVLVWRAGGYHYCNWEAIKAEEGGVHSDLLRDIVGNPFRPRLLLPPSVLAYDDGLVVRLATTAYEARLLPEGHLDPARLAVLADALLDAGCDDAELLSHLRGPGPHVRGCWVVDLLWDRE